VAASPRAALKAAPCGLEVEGSPAKKALFEQEARENGDTAASAL
jgi:hypothetical protein